MKRVCILLAILFISSKVIRGQGIYQLWGTTPYGGADNTGVLFNTDAFGNNFQEKHQFNSYNPGAYPGSCDPIKFNGKFYGMTQLGGNDNLGVLFEWDPSTNTYTKKIDMSSANGSYPYGSLTLNGSKFYGMARTGGINNVGVIFEWDPATNVYTKKIDLNNIDGCEPYGSLTLQNGKFYGMTRLGGINGVGVIFEWDPITNIYTKKIDLSVAIGSNPLDNLTFKDGKFYGMTFYGGNTNHGVIFEWDPVTNEYSKKIDFANGSVIGYYPRGSLTLHDGKFYGMAKWDSMSGSDGGVIFEWDPVTNTYTLKIDFSTSGFSGRNPGGSLTYHEGKFYGITVGATHGLNFFASGLFAWDPVINQITQGVALKKPTGYFPRGSLTLSDGKFYGLTSMGGGNDDGVIFEWDPASNLYSKKIDLNGNNGLYPRSSLSVANGKIYGVTYNGGCDQRGVIYEWNPATEILNKRIDFVNSTGNNPTGNLTLLDGKFYGMTKYQSNYHDQAGIIYEWDPITDDYALKAYAGNGNGNSNGSLTLSGTNFYGMMRYGGINGGGIIFEWNQVTNIFTTKIDLSLATGSNPQGSLTLNGNIFYGMTQFGGSNDAGVIFEWDPVTNIYTKKIDLSTSTGSNPQGSLTLLNGKVYGMTEYGGANDMGVLFEWDPVTNVYTKKIDLSIAMGSNPQGSLTVSNGKLYGMTNLGGTNNLGVLFEWDPITNDYTIKKNYNGINGGRPGLGNDLALLQAPVSNGIAGNCTSFPTVTIDNSNNNTWVPITDNNGDAVAEIKANGNNLGIVSTSAFINNAAVREDAVKRLYLDRNLTITPQFQPSSPVDVRLYIKGSEYLALKNAVNSIGQPSGILSINDVGIFKNDANCEPAITIAPTPVPTNAATWETNYVLTASINSFSSFYFLNKAQGGPLPVTLLEFKGRLQNYNGEISWQTTEEFNTRTFELERSTDGSIFKPIAEIAAINMPGNHKYHYTDKNISSLAVPVVYYRLRQIDLDSRFTYTRVIALNIDKDIIVTLYPNPVSDVANLSISLNKPQQVQARIVDNSGKVIIQNTWKLPSGSSLLSIDVSGLAKGMYFLELKSDMINERRKFVK